MGLRQTVTVELPTDLVRQIREIADRHHWAMKYAYAEIIASGLIRGIPTTAAPLPSGNRKSAAV